MVIIYPNINSVEREKSTGIRLLLTKDKEEEEDPVFSSNKLVLIYGKTDSSKTIKKLRDMIAAEKLEEEHSLRDIFNFGGL